MSKLKYTIGSKINDFTIINITKENNRLKYYIKCDICGDERSVYNLTNTQTTHSLRNCRKVYAKSFVGKLYGDFICIHSYINKRLFLVLKCSKCGIEREVAEKDLKRFSNSHGYTCARALRNLVVDFDETVYNRLITKHKNIIYRTTNPSYHHYETYSKFKLDYKFVADFIIDFYDDYKEACDELGVDNVFIDRIDNDKGYEKGNIRFVDAKKSVWNRKTQTKFTVDGVLYYSACEYSKKENVTHSYISKILKNMNSGEKFNFRGHEIQKL